MARHKVLFLDHYSFHFRPIPHQPVSLFQILGFLSNSIMTTSCTFQFSTDDLTVHLSSLESCLQSLHLWLCQNGLALNSGKSESILFSTPSRIHNFPSVSGVNIAGTLVPISDKIVTLGVTLDRHLALSHHTSNVCRTAYFHIRALRHIRPSLTEEMAITMAVSMLHSRLDYANSLVHGHTSDKR